MNIFKWHLNLLAQCFFIFSLNFCLFIASLGWNSENICIIFRLISNIVMCAFLIFCTVFKRIAYFYIWIRIQIIIFFIRILVKI